MVSLRPRGWMWSLCLLGVRPSLAQVQCGPGQYRSSSQGGICVDTPPGYYSPADDDTLFPCAVYTYSQAAQPFCFPLSCPSGYQILDAGAFPSPASQACVPCPIGTGNQEFAQGGARDCTPCPRGHTGLGGNNDCEPCPQFSYNPFEGANQCFEPNDGFITSNVVNGGVGAVTQTRCAVASSTTGILNGCGNCAITNQVPLLVQQNLDMSVMARSGITGQFCAECQLPLYNPRSPTEHNQCLGCPQGEYPTPANGGSAGFCTACPAGHYLRNGSLMEALSCNSCPGGRASAQPGTPGNCPACPAGTRSAVSNGGFGSMSCIDCVASYSGVGQGVCRPTCPPGTEFPQPAQATQACAACAPGRYNPAPRDDPHTCLACNYPLRSAGGAGSCSATCPAGTEDDTENGTLPIADVTRCLTCPRGKFSSIHSSGQSTWRTCEPCATGTFTPTGGQDGSCQVCDPTILTGAGVILGDRLPYEAKDRRPDPLQGANETVGIGCEVCELAGTNGRYLFITDPVSFPSSVILTTDERQARASYIRDLVRREQGRLMAEGGRWAVKQQLGSAVAALLRRPDQPLHPESSWTQEQRQLWGTSGYGGSRPEVLSGQMGVDYIPHRQQLNLQTLLNSPGFNVNSYPDLLPPSAIPAAHLISPFVTAVVDLEVCTVCPPNTATYSGVCQECIAGSNSYPTSASFGNLCYTCEHGRFSDRTEPTKGCQLCPVGRASGLSGRTAATGGCPVCPPGTYASSEGSTTCLSCTGTGLGVPVPVEGQSCVSCGLGHISVPVQSTPGGNLCYRCPVGRFRAANSTCEFCAPGLTSPGGTDGPCVAPPPCPPGTWYSALPIHADNPCPLCSVGTFSDGSTALTQPCPSCPDGYGVSLADMLDPATFTGGSACVRCARGSYLDRATGTCRFCPAGTVPSGQEAGDPWVFTSCAPVQPGQSTFYTKRLGVPNERDTVSLTTVAIPCDAGYYSTDEGQPTCLVCPLGRTSAPLPETNAFVPTGCVVTELSPSTSQLECEQGTQIFPEDILWSLRPYWRSFTNFTEGVGYANSLVPFTAPVGHTSCPTECLSGMSDIYRKGTCSACLISGPVGDDGMGYMAPDLSGCTPDCSTWQTDLPQPSTGYTPWPGPGAAFAIVSLNPDIGLCGLCEAGTERDLGVTSVPDTTGKYDHFTTTPAPPTTTTTIPDFFAQNRRRVALQAPACLPCGTNPTSGSQERNAGGNAEVCTTACPAGTQFTALSSPECLPCPSGSYSPVQSNTLLRCEPVPVHQIALQIAPPWGTGYQPASCPPGSVQDGTETCRSCPWNQVSEFDGVQYSCTLCPAGSTPNAQRDGCDTCLPGFVTPTQGGPCAPCSIGRLPASLLTTCDTCPLGRWTNTSGQADCDTCNDNGIGIDNIVDPGTGETIPFCTLCPVGKARDYTGSGQTACLDCHAGLFAPTPGMTDCILLEPPCTPGYGVLDHDQNPSSPSFCWPCDPGQYGPGNFSECQTCPAGTANPNTGAATCRDCFPHTFAASPGREVCTLCPAGREAPSPGSTDCPDACTGNQYSTPGSACRSCVPPLGTVKEDHTGCVACPAGKEPPYWGATTCQDCPPGKAGDGVTACQDCTQGRVAPGGAAECTTCSAGQQGNPDGETCDDCVPGFYSTPSGTQGLCTECDVSRFADSPGSPFCADCPAGRTSLPLIAGTACTDCPLGKFSAYDGQTCLNCNPGFVSVGGLTECVGCNPNSGFGASVDQGSCTLRCVAGQFSTSQSGFPGGSVCSTCGTDTDFCSWQPGSTSCELPPAEYYVDPTNRAVCLRCPYGEVHNPADLTECIPSNVTQSPSRSPIPQPTPSVEPVTCPAGEGFDAATMGCQPCAPGYYDARPIPGVGAGTVCQCCPPTTIQPNPAQTSCVNCPGNTLECQATAQCIVPSRSPSGSTGSRHAPLWALVWLPASLLLAQSLVQ